MWINWRHETDHLKRFCKSKKYESPFNIFQAKKGRPNS
jgi:hypothetical protein